MRYILIAGFIVSALFFSTQAQQWPGFETGRFSGVSSANQRPGGMSPIPYKVDITLFGAHLFAQPKSVFGKDFPDMMLSGGFKRFSDFSNLHSDRTMVLSNWQGPSVLGQVSEKVSIAFTWNVRYMWLSDISKPRLTRLFDDETSTLDLTGNNESANMLYTGWNEFGLGVGGLIFDKGFHSFSVGGFAKLVFGTGHMNVNINNLNFLSKGNMVENMSFNVNTDVSENMHNLINDGKIKLVSRLGYGFDVGGEYKFLNPRSCPGGSNYRFKLGISITDIGQVKYESGTHYEQTNASATNVSLETFRNNSLIGTLESIRDTFNINVSGLSDFTVTLPMSLRLYTEVNIKRRAIIYQEFHFMLAQLTDPNMPLVFRYNLTPRFEDYRFGVYLPLTFTNFDPVNAGLAIRLMPIVFGSGNLFTFWAYEDRGKALDFYVTVKIPIVNQDERIDWKAMTQRR